MRGEIIESGFLVLASYMKRINLHEGGGSYKRRRGGGEGSEKGFNGLLMRKGY